VTTVEKADTSADELAATMVGDTVRGGDAVVRVALGEEATGAASLEVPETGRDVRVRVRGLTVPAPSGPALVDGVELELRQGEILAIAGVAGNGQVELAEALTGARPAKGSLTLDGAELVGRRTADWLDAGVVYVPEDRQRDGILPGGDITENLVLGSHRSRAKLGLIDWRLAREQAVRAISEYNVKTPSAATACGQLSGGNIQRVILARAFAHDPKLLLLHNPTRGLDIASTTFVYDRIRAAAARGCVVIVVSEDLDEVIALGDRVKVVYSGRLVGDFARGETDPYELGRLMTGVAA
jgi:simple sugar transport system ATP-binding protein